MSHADPTDTLSYPALRTKAIESLLIEKGYITEEAVDRIASAYETDIGPMTGARVVARAWVDPAYRERLLADGPAAMRELGVGGLYGESMIAVANTKRRHNVVVCTLCSCYPWAALGLPPTWYKSPAYRARVVREPRAVLSEFGVELAADVEIEVWDSSAETRYIVLPERPAGTEDMSEDELAELVTRDSMIGTAVPKAPGP